MMRKKLGIALLTISLMATGVACGKKPEPAQEETKAQTVSVAKVEKTTMSNNLSISGKLAAKEEIKVVPKVPGKIARINVEVGQEVKAGEVLLELDNEDIRARIEVAQAGVRTNEVALEKAKLELEKAQLKFEDVKRNYERNKALYDAGAISLSAYETEKLKYETEIRALEGARLSVSSAEAGLQQSRASLRQSQVDLENSILRTPVSGIVAARNANVGEFISSAVAALTVVDIGNVEVKANLTENDINFVRQGQEVDVKISAAGPNTFKGTISKVSPSADEKSKTYPIWITIANSDNLLKPGMFAEFNLETNRKEGALGVQTAALLDRNGSKVVFVLDGDKASERKVQLGISDGKLSEITEGLKEGEVVITSGLQTLVSGAQVAPQQLENQPEIQKDAPKNSAEGK